MGIPFAFLSNLSGNKTVSDDISLPQDYLLAHLFPSMFYILFQMERMGLERKYIDAVKDNKLNGSSLVFGDVEDLKALLGMTFGEWASFKLHFLSFVSPFRSQSRIMLPSTSKNQPSKFLQYAAHYYSSTPSLC